MVKVNVGFKQDIESIKKYIDKKVQEFLDLEEKYQHFQASSPSADNTLGVDNYFHELREFQIKFRRMYADMEILAPILHMYALETVDEETWKKVKNSNTQITALGQAFSGPLVSLQSNLKGIINECNQSSMQYCMLLKALKE